MGKQVQTFQTALHASFENEYLGLLFPCFCILSLYYSVGNSKKLLFFVNNSNHQIKKS